ncbi:MAG TPA: Hsp20/alpha crystallin family protein [Vicinamibacterales bacterium]|nr:Hsp20/alpha crystallin family protein [Vicinamibacterales bacterium]HWB15489.1 Hsp20/alpha crystallin family protein [Vicinamibacterales bacterium]
MTDFLDQGATDLAEDARRLLLELDRDIPGVSNVTADCRPPLDVIETASAVEVVMDVPGVSADSLRVAIRRNTLLVVGAKLAPAADTNARFHLAERSYGRFARAVRLAGAFDAAHSRAVARAGQLRITLPLIADRRGRIVPIAVERG